MVQDMIVVHDQRLDAINDRVDAIFNLLKEKKIISPEEKEKEKDTVLCGDKEKNEYTVLAGDESETFTDLGAAIRASLAMIRKTIEEERRAKQEKEEPKPESDKEKDK